MKKIIAIAAMMLTVLTVNAQRNHHTGRSVKKTAVCKTRESAEDAQFYQAVLDFYKGKALGTEESVIVCLTGDWSEDISFTPPADSYGIMNKKECGDEAVKFENYVKRHNTKFVDPDNGNIAYYNDLFVYGFKTIKTDKYEGRFLWVRYRD